MCLNKIHLATSGLAEWRGKRQGVPVRQPVGLLQTQGLWDPGPQSLWVAGPCPRRSQGAVMGVRRSRHEEMAQLRVESSGRQVPPQAPIGASAAAASAFLHHWAQNTELWFLPRGTAGSWAWKSALLCLSPAFQQSPALCQGWRR